MQQLFHLKRYPYNDVVTVPKAFSEEETKAVIAFKDTVPKLIDESVASEFSGGVGVFHIPPNATNATWLFEKVGKLVNEVNDKYFQFDLHYLEECLLLT